MGNADFAVLHPRFIHDSPDLLEGLVHLFLCAGREGGSCCCCLCCSLIVVRIGLIFLAAIVAYIVIARLVCAVSTLSIKGWAYLAAVEAPVGALMEVSASTLASCFGLP